jgi:hypothetical protein
VRFYTVHGDPPQPVKPGPEGWPEPKGRPPILLRDGVAVWAVVFGPFWFLAHRLWVEGLAMLALVVAIGLLAPEPAASVLVFALHLLAGFEGRDRLRARLERKGLAELGVVAAPDQDLAWFRLAQQRPDLMKALP